MLRSLVGSEMCIRDSQELERAIHRRVADLGLALAHLEQQLVDRDVLARAEELLDDRLALRGHVEPAILHVRAPALLELARVIRTEFRAFAHGVSFPSRCRIVKRSRTSDIWFRVR